MIGSPRVQWPWWGHPARNPGSAHHPGGSGPLSTSSLTQPRTGVEGRGGSCPGRRSQVLSLADPLPHGTASRSREPRAVGPAARPPGQPAPRQRCVPRPRAPCGSVSSRGAGQVCPPLCRLTKQRDSQSRPASCPISASLRDHSLPSAGCRSGGGIQGGCARVWGGVLHTPCPLADRWLERRWREVTSLGPGGLGDSGPEPRPRGEERSVQVGTRGGELQVDGPPADPARGPGGSFPGRAHCASGGSWSPAEALS